MKLCLSEHFTVHYGLNKIRLAFDAQYQIVILTLLTYLLCGLCLENAGLEPIPDNKSNQVKLGLKLPLVVQSQSSVQFHVDVFIPD